MIEIIQGDSLTVLREMDDESIQCCITSPPYWGLRDYGVDGQLGLEATPEEYVERMVGIFREIRRVLRNDGTLWLNMGDTYVNTTKGSGGHGPKQDSNKGARYTVPKRFAIPASLKSKDLVGMPWRLAFALQADGWWLRSDIIWAKPDPMPEGVRDRPTKSHEHVFLLTKSARYYYDHDAVKEKAVHAGRTTNGVTVGSMRNMRDVWTITTKHFKEAHFATFPPKLVEPCVKAGSAEGDLLLDPFAGAGTVGVVAKELGRDFIGIELNPEYCEMARRRIESS